jgi:hypothetical protein
VLRTKQLEVLVVPDVFEVIDWHGIFNIRATSFEVGAYCCLPKSVYSKVTREFGTDSNSWSAGKPTRSRAAFLGNSASAVALMQSRQRWPGSGLRVLTT